MMNKVLFKIRDYEVKVRDVAILIIILLLLLSLAMCNREKSKEAKIEDAVKNTCKFPKQNVKDLNALLARGDLCSSKWFEDVDTFIERLQDQQKALKKNKTKHGKALYKVQEKLLKELKNFKEDQSNKTIDELEKALKDYQITMKKGCK